MPRYIDADKMLDGYSTTFPYNLTYCDDGDLMEWINNQPTADVIEVVRCKDCRHCKFNPDSEAYKCNRRGYFIEEVEADGFCSYGEGGQTMAERCLLHQNKLDLFRWWLSSIGYEIQPIKSEGEVLRAAKDKDVIVVSKRQNAKEHLTVQKKDCDFVKHFLKQQNEINFRKRKNDEI